MQTMPITAGASTTTKSMSVSIALQQGKSDAAPAAQAGERNRHGLDVAWPWGDGHCGSIHSGPAQRRLAIGWRVQKLLDDEALPTVPPPAEQRALVCPHCRK